MTNLAKQKPMLKLWSAEPAPENLGHPTDVVLRATLPNGGAYCHKFAKHPAVPLEFVVEHMDANLNMLLERGFDE